MDAAAKRHWDETLASARWFMTADRLKRLGYTVPVHINIRSGFLDLWCGTHTWIMTCGACHTVSRHRVRVSDYRARQPVVLVCPCGVANRTGVTHVL